MPQNGNKIVYEVNPLQRPCVDVSADKSAEQFFEDILS